MKKIQLLLLALLLASNNPLVTKNPDNSTSAGIKNIEKLENKKCSSQISKYIKPALAMTTKATVKITKISLIMMIQYTLSYVKAGMARRFISIGLEQIINSSPPDMIKSAIAFAMVSISILDLFKQASKIQNISYDLLNKENSTQNIFITVSSLSGFLRGIFS